MFANLKLYALIAAGLAIGLLLWREKYLADRNKQLRAQNDSLTQTIATERANRKTEAEDRQRADQAAISLQAELDRIAAIPDPPRVLCRAARVPGAAGQGGAAAGADAAAEAGRDEGPLRDIGPFVGAARREAEANAAAQLALQEWERARTH